MIGKRDRGSNVITDGCASLAIARPFHACARSVQPCFGRCATVLPLTMWADAPASNREPSGGRLRQGNVRVAKSRIVEPQSAGRRTIVRRPSATTGKSYVTKGSFCLPFQILAQLSRQVRGRGADLAFTGRPV